MTEEHLYTYEVGHSRRKIMDIGKHILFECTECFDYDTGEWDNYSVLIKKAVFYNGFRKFLSDGFCLLEEDRRVYHPSRYPELGKVVMEKEVKKISITVRAGYDIFTSHHSGDIPLIVHKNEMDIFIKKLKNIAKKDVAKYGIPEEDINPEKALELIDYINKDIKEFPPSEVLRAIEEYSTQTILETKEAERNFWTNPAVREYVMKKG